MGLRDIVILAICFGSLPFAFMRPWFGILLWTWIGLMNPHRLGWATHYYPVAQGTALAVLGGLLLTQDKRPPPFRLEIVVIVLMFLHFTFTSFLAWYPQVSWVQWEKVFKILLFIVITPMVIYGKERVRLLFLTIVFSLGFYGVKGGVFSITTGGGSRVWGPLGSFIGDNNSLGLALCMILPLAFYAAKAEDNKWVRWALWAVFFLSIPAILFTYSRGAFLGLAVVAVVLLWKYRVVGAGLLLVGAIAFPLIMQVLPEQWVQRQQSTLEYEEDHSAMTRLQAWGVATNIALESPLTGAGFNFEYAGHTQRWLSYANFVEPWASQERAAHSIYFQVLGQHGFLGLGLFLTLLGGAFVRLNSLARRAERAGVSWIACYARGAQFSLLPYAVSGAFLSLAYFDLFYLVAIMSPILWEEYSTFEARSSEPRRETGGKFAPRAS